MPADPTPAPAWAVKIALIRKWGARKAALVDDPDPDSLELASVIASVRDAALREAADGLRMLRPNSEGYRRTEWDGFDFDQPCADAIDRAFDVGAADILKLVGTAPKEAPRG